jgi:hypothetical protein
MKKLLFIALMLGFLAGNAQQDWQQFGPNGTRATVQFYPVNHPGLPVDVDMNKNTIRKTDMNTGYPVDIDMYKNTIRKPDYHPGIPIVFDTNKDKIKETDRHIGHPVEFDLNRYTIRKPD